MKPTAEETTKHKCIERNRYETCINPHEILYRGCTDKCKFYAAAVKSEPAEGAELTKEEYAERERLIELQKNNTRWFSQEEFDRLKELSKKMFKNAGSPHTAEGAEEILKKYWIFSIDNPDTQKQCIIDAMNEFAALHAQRLADKMVEERMQGKKFVLQLVNERLRMELELYNDWLFGETAHYKYNVYIDEYLKSREK